MLKTWKPRLFLCGCLLLTVGFLYQKATPFFLSAGAVFIGLSALLVPSEIKISKGGGAIILLWLIVLLGGFYSEDTGAWKNIMTRQLSLVFIPLGFMSYQVPERHKRIIAFSFLSVLSLFAVLSLLRYLIHYEAVNLSLTHSGAVPVWDGISNPLTLTAENKSKFLEDGISHIYFSVLQAIAVLFSWIYWKKEKKIFWLVFGIINLVIMHWFLTRTGILALYSALLIILLMEIVKSGKVKWLLWVLIPAVLLPLISYVALDSVQKKVKNTVEDIQAVNGERDINHRSFAMRIEAWKTALRIIKRNPILGVGPGDMHQEMQDQYEADHTTLYRKNRIPPHNQYIETTLGSGLLGLACLLFIISFFIAEGWKSRNFLLLGTAVIFAISLLFESMLQTQVGICMVPFFLLWREKPDQV